MGDSEKYAKKPVQKPLITPEVLTPPIKEEATKRGDISPPINLFAMENKKVKTKKNSTPEETTKKGDISPSVNDRNTADRYVLEVKTKAIDKLDNSKVQALKSQNGEDLKKSFGDTRAWTLFLSKTGYNESDLTNEQVFKKVKEMALNYFEETKQAIQKATSVGEIRSILKESGFDSILKSVEQTIGKTQKSDKAQQQSAT